MREPCSHMHLLFRLLFRPIKSLGVFKRKTGVFQLAPLCVRRVKVYKDFLCGCISVVFGACSTLFISRYIAKMVESGDEIASEAVENFPGEKRKLPGCRSLWEEDVFG